MKRIWCVLLLAAFTASCSSASEANRRSQSTARVGAPLAEGVGPVSASALAQVGIYVGPAGTIPAGVPTVPDPTVANTVVNGATSVAGTQPTLEELAVRGDPANGTATVTAQVAGATTLTSVDFAGPVTVGATTLVQFDGVEPNVVATAWVTPVTGTVDWAGGPAATPGHPVTPHPPSVGTAVVFIDAVTGKLISAEIFGGVSVPTR